MSAAAARLARWVLGGLFIYLGLSKVLHGAEFLKYVQEQLLVRNPFFAGGIAAVAPWLEVLYGVWLLAGIARPAAAVIGRWQLGIVFIIMGLHKALPHPEAFLKLVRQYDLVTHPLLLNAIGAALPWFEVFCGVLLLAGPAMYLFLQCAGPLLFGCAALMGLLLGASASVTLVMGQELLPQNAGVASGIAMHAWIRRHAMLS